MPLSEILQQLRDQRASHTFELAAINRAIEALERADAPAERTASARPKPKAPTPRKAKAPKARPARASRPAPEEEAPSTHAAPKSATEPAHHLGRVPFAKGVMRLDFASRDEAIGAARRLADRGYARERKRPLTPGTFDLLTRGDGFVLVWVERPGDDSYAAREAAA